MALDFSKLDNLTADPPAHQSGDTQSASGKEPPNAPEPSGLQRQAEQTRAKQIEAREIYGRYQDNIKRCGSLRNDLLKGSAAGIPLEQLLLIAVELIDRMTGDQNTTSLKVLRRNLYEQYGIGEHPY